MVRKQEETRLARGLAQLHQLVFFNSFFLMLSQFGAIAACERLLFMGGTTRYVCNGGGEP